MWSAWFKALFFWRTNVEDVDPTFVPGHPKTFQMGSSTVFLKPAIFHCNAR